MSGAETHDHKPRPYGVPVGVTIGIIVGFALGSATASVGIWVIGGMLLGTVAGVAYNRKATQ